MRASGCDVGTAKIQPLEGTDGFVQQRVHVTARRERFSSTHVFKEKLYFFSMPVELAVVIQVLRSFLHLTLWVASSEGIFQHTNLPVNSPFTAPV